MRSRAQLGDEAAARIREMIMDGRLRPGEFLRMERLAAAFGISITPVREALQSLRSQGFLRLAPHRGFVVAPLSPQDVADLFWVQATIAAELTQRAAAAITPEVLAELDLIHEATLRAAAAGRFDRVEECDVRFHRTVNLAAGSAKLAWSLGMVTRYVPAGLHERHPDWSATVPSDHQHILAALRRGDAGEAARLMRLHVAAVGELLIDRVHRGDDGAAALPA